EQGLLVTNHHCGYRQIQKHSTIEHDYLTDGFWAMGRKDELSNPGLTVTRLVRMEDVTAQMLDGVQEDMMEKERDSIIKQNAEKLEKAAVENTGYDARIRPFYYGNEYYLFITEKFKDIRLVGAPPSNIGKFGGDTDNWMWPRHTGDFSMFRIYVNKDNQPAEYSEDNVPYHPLYTLPISVKGVQEDDFTFIFGFPGRTQEYLPSDAIEMITQVQNPASIELRRQKLDIYESFMNQDPGVRIQYSAKHAGLSNGWKKWIGENKGILKLDGIQRKKEYEQRFMEWANSSPQQKLKYGDLLPAFDESYAIYSDYRNQYSYWMEAAYRLEIVTAAMKVNKLVDMSKNKEAGKEDIQAAVEQAKASLQDFYTDYYLPVDKRVVMTMLESYRTNIQPGKLPPVFNLIDKKFDGSIPEFVDYLFDKSMFSSEGRTMHFLINTRSRNTRKLKKIRPTPWGRSSWIITLRG
nr:S46 family peptidase [Bacteroidota bacterium]